jgi:general L-amino acid transport system permease protein
MAPSQAAVPPWRDARVLNIVAQVVAVAVVLAIGLLLWGNLTASMDRSQLSFGLGFLDSTAGFEIAEAPIPYRATDSYGLALLVGLLNTIVVSIVGIVLATLLGLVVGIARLSGNWLVNRVASGYVEVMRNTPLLVQLVLIYAVMLQLPRATDSISLPGSIFLNQRGLFAPRPIVEPAFGTWLLLVVVAVVILVAARRIGARQAAAGRSARLTAVVGVIGLVAIPVVGWVALGSPIRLEPPALQGFNFVGGLAVSPEFTALLVGLVIYTAAFIGEVVRGGIQAVRRGQIEAAMALGLSSSQTLRLVVFPQALRIIVPPLTSQYLNLAKNSSLAVVIGYPELFNVSRTTASQTGQPVSVIILVMAAYLTISLGTSLLMNLYNRRVQVMEQ